MIEEAAFLAIDLGAESGRVFLGHFDGERVALEEIHRFPNEPVQLIDGLYWDVLSIFREIKEGLAKAATETGRLESIGVDSWGLDFALLDREGVLVSNPHNHRDPRTEGMVERAFELVPKEEIYETTGIQFIRINTLYQLLAMQDSPLLKTAESLLLIPDLINYWLTGEQACEFTNATTTQLYDLEAGEWARDLLQRMSLPVDVFPKIISPATELGPLLTEVAEEVGYDAQIPVVVVASHDTASAIVAIPAEGENFAYVSSGTWSLVGVETPLPVVTREAMDANFTNEGGFWGRTRFLKNVMGLWLLQECRRLWAREGQNYSYEELAQLAEEAPAYGPLVDPDHPSFLAPGDIPSRIRRFCETTDQRPPEEPGQVTRCVFESLTLKYRWVVEQAAEIAGQNVEAVHVVGGGSQNSLLCQLTADATQLPVLAGPVEATALGNVMVQAYARGHVESLEEIRAIVRRSTEITRYSPRGGADEWDEFWEKFSGVMKASEKIDDLEGE
jgi:rhamnulokinase